MRKIFLNIESVYGRIAQISAIETIDDKKTGNNFIRILNPQVEIDIDDALENLSYSNFADALFEKKPIFKDIIDEFIKYISDSRIYIYSNAQQNILFKEIKQINYPLLKNDFVSMKRICICQPIENGNLTYRLFMKGNVAISSQKYDYAFFKRRKEITILSKCNMLFDVY